MRKMKNACNIWVQKYEKKRLLGRSKHKWEENIKWILMMQSEDVNWIQLSQNMVPVKTVGISQVLQKQEIS
jgi:hypothetical protein